MLQRLLLINYLSNYLLLIFNTILSRLLYSTIRNNPQKPMLLFVSQYLNQIYKWFKIPESKGVHIAVFISAFFKTLLVQVLQVFKKE